MIVRRIAPRDCRCLTVVAVEAGKELMYTRTSFFSSLLLTIEGFQMNADSQLHVAARHL